MQIRALYEILSTAIEAGASDIRFSPRGAILLRIDGLESRLDEARFAPTDLHELARFIAWRARTRLVPAADGGERPALVYGTDPLGPFEVASEPGEHGQTLILGCLGGRVSGDHQLPEQRFEPSERRG